jgi:hypothetical protein
MVEWRKSREKCRDLYCLPENTAVNKLKILKWAGRQASMGKRTGGYGLEA